MYWVVLYYIPKRLFCKNKQINTDDYVISNTQLSYTHRCIGNVPDNTNTHPRNFWMSNLFVARQQVNFNTRTSLPKIHIFPSAKALTGLFVILEGQQPVRKEGRYKQCLLAVMWGSSHPPTRQSSSAFQALRQAGKPHLQDCYVQCSR